MKDTFSSAELTALRNDLIHDVLIDSREADRNLELVSPFRKMEFTP